MLWNPFSGDLGPCPGASQRAAMRGVGVLQGRLHNPENLARALKAAGVAPQVRIYPALKHVGILLALSGRFATDAPVMEDSLQFIRACPGQ